MPLLVLGCDSSESSAWRGEQVCTVGIPAFGAGDDVVTTSRPIDPEVIRDDSGVRLRPFAIGPVAGFSCRGDDDLVARYSGSRDGTDLLDVEPFECTAADGRVYAIEGTGGSDLEAIFLTQTVDVWMDGGRSLLVCTTALRLQSTSGSLDAGSAADPVAPGLAVGDAG